MIPLDKIQLSRILETNEISERVISFAWIQLANENINIGTYRAESITADFIATELAGYLNSKNKIKNDIKNNLIPQMYFKWIKNNDRQPYWIEQSIIKQIVANNNSPTSAAKSIFNSHPTQPITHLPFTVPIDLTGRNRAIAIFDYWASTYFYDNGQRILWIKEKELEWARQAKLDKAFDWLNSGDSEKKRDVFWDWLCAHNVRGTSDNPKFYNHDELLNFFDAFQYAEHEKKYFNLCIRKLWNQQQRRENTKDKKQCNFIISKEAEAKLKALAKKFNLTRTEIIELLIDSEDKHKTYINERLNRKDHLTKQLSRL